MLRAYGNRAEKNAAKGRAPIGIFLRHIFASPETLRISLSDCKNVIYRRNVCEPFCVVKIPASVNSHSSIHGSSGSSSVLSGLTMLKLFQRRHGCNARSCGLTYAPAVFECIAHPCRLPKDAWRMNAANRVSKCPCSAPLWLKPGRISSARNE